MPCAPSHRPTGTCKRTIAICLLLVLLAVAANVSQATTSGPTRKVSRTVGIGPQIQGLQLSWMDVELVVKPGERVTWDWYADNPLRFYIVSPTGTVMASVDGVSSSEGSAMMSEEGYCKAAWMNPSFKTPVTLHLSVEVRAGGGLMGSPASPQDGSGAEPGWQWVPDVAVALLLLLACEVTVTVPMLVLRARAGQGRARVFPIDFTDAYLCLGPEVPVGPGGLPMGAPARPRPMEGALTVVRGARR